MFLFGVRKNICTAPFPDAQELLSWSTLKANVCIFLYISLRKVLFQRRSKILSGDMGSWGRLNNFKKVARCLVLVKCFTSFHFNWNFSKFYIFQYFNTFINNFHHNGIFHPMILCHTLSILLYHFPWAIHKTSLRNYRTGGKNIFAYMAASAYHITSMEVENHIFKHYWIFRHLFTYQ